jgi:hypothetical protein
MLEPAVTLEYGELSSYLTACGMQAVSERQAARLIGIVLRERDESDNVILIPAEK